MEGLITSKVTEETGVEIEVGCPIRRQVARYARGEEKTLEYESVMTMLRAPSRE